MTRIDFHSNVPDKVAYACRLVRKARAADCSIVLFVNDRAQRSALDDALWTFSAADFLPHAMADDALAAHTPILLTGDDQLPLPHHQVLINLSTATPANFTQFERVIEVVSSEVSDIAAGRERYHFYKQQGYPPTHHVAEKT